jgi:hypothetical protein
VTSQTSKLERRLRQSAALVSIGLIAELISLLWYHPTAFFMFLAAGALLITAGILFYLYSLVTVSEPSLAWAPETAGSSLQRPEASDRSPDPAAQYPAGRLDQT